MNLLLHSSGFGNLANVYSSNLFGSLNSQGMVSDLISKILGLRLGISNLTATDLKTFILNFGLFNEAALSKKKKLHPLNQKVLIGQLARLLSERGIDTQNITRALLDIEASQLESNQSLQNREILFSLIFPFKDFGEWNFSFSKMKNPKKGSEEAYTFNLHTKNPYLGEVWLRVVVEKTTNLTMQMWATNSDTYSKALKGEEKLSKLLSDAGLTVSSFDIFNNKKPGTNKDDNEKPKFYENVFSGSTIDVEA